MIPNKEKSKAKKHLIKMLFVGETWSLEEVTATHNQHEEEKKDKKVFEEVYCAAFYLFDKLWLEKKANTLEFKNILQSTKLSLESHLENLKSHQNVLQQNKKWHG